MTNTPYLEEPIHRIQNNLYTISKIEYWKILKDIKHGLCSKKSPIRRCADFEGSIKEFVTETMTEPTWVDTWRKFERITAGILLHQVDHTAKFLAILELIKIPNVDPNQLQIHVFPLSLTGATRKWWIDEENGWNTKNALWEFWINGGDDEVLMDDIVSSANEREESGNTNHPNDNADSFFKPYLDTK
ncbi:hypothetical protein Tco_1138729 [Tanacetum coccineum]